MKNLKIGSRRVKGFTLIEMIVVIAIIAILAGTSSIVIEGFNRDARIETNDKKAHMAYTAFQDMLIDCEIKQDDTLLSPQANTDSLILRFKLTSTPGGGAGIENLNVDVRYNGGVHYDSPIDDTSAYHEKLENLVAKNLDSTAEGEYIIYMNFQDYVVNSVLYDDRARSGGDDDEFDFSSMEECFRDINTSINGYKFCVMCNLKAHKKFAKSAGMFHMGAYPYYTDYLHSADEST